MGHKKFKVLTILTRINSNLMLQLKAFNQHNAVVRGATVKLGLRNAWTHLTGNHIYPKKKMVKSDLLPDGLDLKEKKIFWKVYEIHTHIVQNV